jgi:hypothetical protein
MGLIRQSFEKQMGTVQIIQYRYFGSMSTGRIAHVLPLGR